LLRELTEFVRLGLLDLVDPLLQLFIESALLLLKDGTGVLLMELLEMGSGIFDFFLSLPKRVIFFLLPNMIG